MALRFSSIVTCFKPVGLASALAFLMALPPAIAAAERREQATFDLELRGIRAGSIVFSSVSNDAAYSAAVRLQSSGIVNLVRRIRYDGQVQGRIVAGALRPTRYQDTFDNGRRESTMLMEYTARTPSIVTQTPPRERQDYDIEASQQTGTVDILTAVFAVFRDAPRAQVCNLDLVMFDGRRRTQLAVTGPSGTGATVTCAGEYRRIAGFPPHEMAERTRYPFTLVYAEGPDGMMRLEQVQMESTQGRGRLIRR